MSKAEELADKLLLMEQSGLWYRSQDAAAELRRLSAINAELLESLKTIVADRDECANGQEKYVQKSESNLGPYWSPSATMVHGEFIAAARAAIAKAQGEQP